MWDLMRFGDRQAVVDEFGNSLTYSELTKAGDVLAERIGGRCLVFLLCENRIGSIMGYSAFIEHGIVPVLLNAHMDHGLLDNLLQAYQPAYVWLPQTCLTQFLEFEEIYSAWEYSLVKTSYERAYELYPELCLLLTTSGSTGSPKFVRQSYENVRINAQSIVEYLELTADERPITTLPMNYTYGLSIINSHFMVGATLLVTEKGLMQKEFWEFLKKNKATSFGGVPYTYEMLDKLRFFRMELPSLRYMTQAGGKLIPELHRKFAEYAIANDKKFIVMYGQCEATARMGYLPAQKALERCGSMGIAIPGGKFKLIDENDEEIGEPNVTGELVYEGANVTLGYAECGEDLKKGDERHGILKTGDMAEVDKDGYYYIVGRKKRFLKIYGNRVNLDEIDRMIKGAFEGIEAASAGEDDHMIIFLTDAGQSDDVKRFVVDKTKLNASAFQTMIVEEIPKNDAGKVLYRELEKLYKNEANG